MSALPEDILNHPQYISTLPELVFPQAQELRELPESNKPRRILTAIDGHDFMGSPAVRTKVALTDDGTLYLAEDARADPLVLSYIAMLDRRAELSEGKIVPYKDIRYVPFTEIQRLYESADDVTGELSAGNRTAEESQVISLLAEAIQERASDIFLDVLPGAGEVAYRVAGDVEQRFAMKPDRAKQLIRTVCDAMSEAFSDQNYDVHKDQTGRMKRKFFENLGSSDGVGLRQVRISTGPTDEERPFMALRLHYDLGEPRSVVELGFLPSHAEEIEEVMHCSHGMVLFSGPTGSGKSTTLANCIGHRQKLDNRRRKIISLEDPPEIPIYGVTQKAVLRKGLGREAEGQAWLDGFDTLMRWNPDWIIAGELRLRETMDAALKAALTNHLTWGMLHASSATLVPVRLQEAGIELGYLCDPEIFRVFTNQSLVPEVCPHCSTPYSQGSHLLSKGQRARIEKHCTADTVRLRGSGCKHCHRGALRSRTICAEVMTTDQELLDVYRKSGALALRRHWVRERGGLTKTAHMIGKINAGQVCPTDAERIVLPLNSDDML